MTSKVLRWIGIAALIALVGGSFAALLVVKERLHITVADEEAAARRGPDPIASLAADLAAVREDVRVVGDGVGTRMQTLHGALEESAVERESRLNAEIAELRREVLGLKGRIDQAATDQTAARAQVLRALDQLGRGLQDVATAVSEGSTKPLAVAPIELPPTPEIAVEPAAVVVPEPVVAPSVPAAPKKGFLSFQLPGQGFRFDELQRYTVVPSLSRVGFDAKSTLHDFSGVTTAIGGEFTANLAQPAQGCSGFVTAQSATLDTGVEGRDESMREILEPKKFPEIRFDWSGFDATSVDAVAQRVAGTAKGKLSIHGVSRDIAMPVTVSVDASKRVAVEGQWKIKLSDYGVKPPSKLGLISVDDDAVVWIALRARTLGAVAAEKH